MAYRMRCGDAGMDCPGTFVTETREELMDHITLHAQKAHPSLELDEATKKNLKGLIKQES